MRKFGGVEAGFSPYLSHMLPRFRTLPDVLLRIVAPKVAGSSPVGHPPIFRIGKVNSQIRDAAWCSCWALLTTP
jgi:hypothetical protein